MSTLLLIVIGTVLVNTFLLTQSHAAIDSDRDLGTVATAMRVAAATLITLLLAVIVTSLLVWPIAARLLSWHLQDLLLFIYALSVVGMALLLHGVARHRLPKLRRSLATSPVLIVSTCLALASSSLGTGLLDFNSDYFIAELFLGALAVGIAFGILLTVFIALNERIGEREVPEVFRGAPIALISAGLIALALMGFTGLWRV